MCVCVELNIWGLLNVHSTCMYIYIYTYVHESLYTALHTHIHIYRCIYIYVHVIEMNSALVEHSRPALPSVA